MRLAVNWLIRECFNIISERPFDVLTLRVFNTDNIQRVLYQLLLNETVEFALMFDLTVYPFICVIAGDVRNRKGHF